MSTATWSALGTRSSNIASTTLNSLANGSESSNITYDNTTNKALYGLITLKLGSITPSTGGSVTLRVTISDGTDTSDSGADGDLYVFLLKSGASAKTDIKKISLVGGCSLRFSFVNNSGVTLAASGNEVYVTPFNEDIA